MNDYQYLIVGGGMTADAAVRGIREVDSEGTIGLVSAEGDAPYNRPPLSKGLWNGKPLDSIWRHTAKAEAALHLDRRVSAIDLEQKQAVDAHGDRYGFEKLLLATGARPRRLSPESDRIIHFRTLADYRRLRALTARAGRFAVVGGGFIGSEIAAALANTGNEVVLLFPEEGIGARLFPRELSLFLNDFYREKGVIVVPGETVAHVEARGERLAVQTGSKREYLVEGLVVGIGCEPNIELAREAALEVDNGIVVDRHLRTGHRDVYAAGDVAAFQSPALDRRLRVEHEDNANTMGRVAGKNMAGEAIVYDHLPFFYSDLFDLGYEAVGVVRSDLDTLVDWQEPYRKGVIYYRERGRVRGVLLWNVWDQIEAARHLIADPRPSRESDLRGRLPETEG